jgi:hypothetical protein
VTDEGLEACRRPWVPDRGLDSRQGMAPHGACGDACACLLVGKGIPPTVTAFI